MKIIDIGICVNNTDPKGLGRIRYRPYGLFVSELEGGINYEEWDELDPLIASPFLPYHINIIPQVQQSVKLLKYDTDKDIQNVEYVGGPYTSPHDVQNQTFLSQHTNTPYGGVIVKGLKDIRDKDGNINSPASSGAIVNEKDIGIHGNYGSDIIFTEDGLQLRGGMLISKKSGNKKSILDYPQLSKKMGKLSLKKFPKTIETIKTTETSTSVAVSKLKYIIEYEIDNLITPTQLKLFIYKVVNEYGTQFNTDVFGDNSVFLTGDTTSVRLINAENDSFSATYTVSLNGTIQSAYIELRELLHLIDIENLTSLNVAYPNEDVHPFYYRSTPLFKLSKGTGDEVTNKATFLNKIQVRNKIGGSGLIYSRQSANPPLIGNKRIVDDTKEFTGEQSFSALSADKVFLLSTNPIIGTNIKLINFNELNDYELTQDDYVNKIDPNTYALVRGEVLYNLVIAMKNLMDSHIHNINEPLVKTDENWVKLNSLIETLRNDLLNDSIRIN